jgi:arylsulfatase A-like enzyme
MLGEFFREIDDLGLRKKTIVVFYADHGDMFGKHGRFMRGGPLRGTFYDDVLKIPLIVYHPKLQPRSVDGLIQVIDLAPTLLDWLKIPAPSTFVGKSAVPLLQGNKINDFVFAGSAFTPTANNPFFKYPSVIMSARDLSRKLIVERVIYPEGPRDTLEYYDLKKDPQELTNQAASQSEAVLQLKRELNHWLQRIQATNLNLNLAP